MILKRLKKIIAIALGIFLIVLTSTHYAKFHICKRNNDALLQEKKEITSLFGIAMQGANKDEIIKNLIEETEEFDYCDKERQGIEWVTFCGVPCGLNIQSEQKNGTTVVTSVVLFTSLQDKATFDNLKRSISKKYGNPDLEEYEGETEEIDGRYYGKCRWDNGAIMLRNVQSDKGGLLIILSPTVNNGHLSGNKMITKADSSIKTNFVWKDSRGDEFPVYINRKDSCFVIRTSKNGENYKAYLGKEVSEQICRELKMKEKRNN